eukprot:14900044-Alexandrium_andersonii.AAC.1
MCIRDRVRTTTALNNPLAKIEKGQNSRMEGAAAYSRPAGRYVLVPRPESASASDPFAGSSGSRGRRAKRGSLGAQRRILGVAGVR